MQTTFEEIVAQNFRNDTFVMQQKVIAAMVQVKSCTVDEFCDALLGVNLPAETVKKIGKIIEARDSIKTEQPCKNTSPADGSL